MFYRITLNQKAQENEIKMDFDVPSCDIPFYVELKEDEDSLTINLEYDRPENKNDIKKEAMDIQSVGNTDSPDAYIIHGKKTGRIYAIHFPKTISKNIIVKSINVIKRSHPKSDVKRQRNNADYSGKIIEKAFDKYQRKLAASA